MKIYLAGSENFCKYGENLNLYLAGTLHNKMEQKNRGGCFEFIPSRGYSIQQHEIQRGGNKIQ